MDKMDNSTSNVDMSLYSRQIAVLGKTAMNSLTNAKVIILGFDGTCLELCKNLILAGVGIINVVSSVTINVEDLSTNYYASTDDIGKNTAEVVKNKLSELNPYVIFKVNDMEVDINYDVHILINQSYETASKLNKKVRTLRTTNNTLLISSKSN